MGEKLDSPVTPVHPALEHRSITIRDIALWSYTMGISPTILVDIVRGRSLPNPIMRERMLREWSAEEVDLIYQDYDPLRHMVFYKNKPEQPDYVLHEEYPTTLLSAGDLLRCDDGRLLEISDVRRNLDRMEVDSGGVYLAHLSIHDQVRAYVYQGDGEVSLPVENSMVKQKQDNQRLREVFGVVSASPERMRDAENIVNILEQIAEGGDPLG